jgi:hypothetical protein
MHHFEYQSFRRVEYSANLNRGVGGFDRGEGRNTRKDCGANPMGKAEVKPVILKTPRAVAELNNLW